MHVTHTFSCAMAWVTFTWVTLHVIIAHAWPVVMERRKRSLVSSTRRQVIALRVYVQPHKPAQSSHYDINPMRQACGQALIERCIFAAEQPTPLLIISMRLCRYDPVTPWRTTFSESLAFHCHVATLTTISSRVAAPALLLLSQLVWVSFGDVQFPQAPAALLARKRASHRAQPGRGARTAPYYSAGTKVVQLVHCSSSSAVQDRLLHPVREQLASSCPQLTCLSQQHNPQTCLKPASAGSLDQALMGSCTAMPDVTRLRLRP